MQGGKPMSPVCVYVRLLRKEHINLEWEDQEQATFSNAKALLQQPQLKEQRLQSLPCHLWLAFVFLEPRRGGDNCLSFACCFLFNHSWQDSL